MRLFSITLLALTLVACSNSSDEMPLAQNDTDQTGGGSGDGSGDDSGDVLNDVDPIRLQQLEDASSIDGDLYRRIFEDAKAVGSEGKYDANNYLKGLSAGAGLSSAQALFARAELLSLIEKQINAGHSPLTLLPITEGDFNRIHACPDGGRLLSDVIDPERLTDGEKARIISGSFKFEECRIGKILIDGSYSTDVESAYSDGFALASFSMWQMRITGSDSITTNHSSSVKQAVIVENHFDGSGFTITTRTYIDLNRLEFNIPDMGDFKSSIKVNTLESATSKELIYVTATPEVDFRSVEMRSSEFGVNDDAFVSLYMNILPPLIRESATANFKQGKISLRLKALSNSVDVQVDNGDPSTFDAFIVERDDSMVSFVADWDSSNLEIGPTGRLPVLFSLDDPE